MAEQLPFDLSPGPVFTFENFIDGQSNAIAVRSLKSFPDWPAPVFILFGPAGSGKTHLGTAWATTFDNVIFQDNATELSDPDLFTVINRALNGEIDGLVVADREHPDHWNVQLPDLRSRLNFIPKLELEEPDEDVLSPVIRKLFEDRGRAIKSDIVSYIIDRYERSVPAVAQLVEALDLAASQDKRDITQAFVSRFLKREV